MNVRYRSARRVPVEQHSPRDRWLVSYADFITLMFAFFVVMYALSSVNEGKYRILTESLNDAFGKGQREVVQDDTTIAPIDLRLHNEAARLRAEATAKRRERRMRELAATLKDALAPLDAKAPLQITQTSKGIVIEIGANALFSPAEAKLEAHAVEVLSTAAKVLASSENALRIEGHTDAVPIATPVYPSNWELSAARASAVARLFVDNGVRESRIGVTGYAANRPVDRNDTAEGRARNRRVTLLVLAESEDAKELREDTLAP